MSNIIPQILKYLKISKQEDPQIKIIDENNPLNVLRTETIDISSRLGGLPYSKEGFSHNRDKQSELARFLIDELNLREIGPLLDVGYGANLYVAKTFHDEGIQTQAIDLVTKESSGGSIYHSPTHIRVENGVEIISGDIADIDENDSVLKKDTYGLILFNGSWNSGGNNWTVGGETLEGKYHFSGEKKRSMIQFMEQEKGNILRKCRDHLTEEGLIGVVSSRYAYHGAGWDFTGLPEEKLAFIELYDQFQRLGAKNVYLVGISQEGFDEIIRESINEYTTAQIPILSQKIYETRKQLQDVTDLPREDCYSRYGDDSVYRLERIDKIISATESIPELNKLARIDAIFGSF